MSDRYPIYVAPEPPADLPRPSARLSPPSRREAVEALGGRWLCVEYEYLGSNRTCTPTTRHADNGCHWAVPAGGDDGTV